MKRFSLFGSALVIGGLLAIAAALLFDAWETGRVSVAWLLSELVKEIGLGAFLLGVFNFILSHRDWQKYFEERLKSVVMDYGYLRGLSGSALLQLMRNVFKAQAGDTAIESEDAFLNYFERNLRHFIEEPYRENAIDEYHLLEMPNDPTRFKVTHKHTHALRAVGGKINSTISYTFEKQEAVTELKTGIIICLPWGDKITLMPSETVNPTGDGVYEVRKEIPLNIQAPQGFARSTSALLDRTTVQIESTYSVEKERMQMWWMTVLTKNIMIIYRYPEAYTIQLKSFMLSPERIEWNLSPGYARFSNQSWVLPNNGVAWKLIQREAPIKAIS